MLVLALLASAAAEQPAKAETRATLEAQATVRIISGSTVTLGEEPEQAELRETSFRDRDGRVQPARLIEFQ